MTNNLVNNWGPALIVLFGYLLGLYFQGKRLDDFKDNLYKYLDAKFESINIKFKSAEDNTNTRFKVIEDRLDKIENRLDKKLVS